MSIRNWRIAAAFVSGNVLFVGAPLSASVLFENSVRDYQASGPVALGTGQSASACATNLDESPVPLFIALLAADNAGLVASKQITLQPGTSVYVSYRAVTPPDQQLSPPVNVVGILVPAGHLNANGGIVQDRPGSGGCIFGSVQIQLVIPNNTPAQTVLYAQMVQHLDRR